MLTFSDFFEKERYVNNNDNSGEKHLLFFYRI